MQEKPLKKPRLYLRAEQKFTKAGARYLRENPQRQKSGDAKYIYPEMSSPKCPKS
jgi:hypothetical protein